MPVTVKLRVGWREGEPNVAQVAQVVRGGGRRRDLRSTAARASSVTAAPPTGSSIGRVAAERGVPVIGNGDILTHYEAQRPAEPPRRALG